mmetsp:Transcript_20798/g.35479  ORF Transcript_20798/g.35479 Transcript_20798/m.35479 type:complete len:113 (+) Transcript_20798:76-414(+)
MWRVFAELGFLRLSASCVVSGADGRVSDVAGAGSDVDAGAGLDAAVPGALLPAVVLEAGPDADEPDVPDVAGPPVDDEAGVAVPLDVVVAQSGFGVLDNDGASHFSCCVTGV